MCRTETFAEVREVSFEQVSCLCLRKHTAQSQRIHALRIQRSNPRSPFHARYFSATGCRPSTSTQPVFKFSVRFTAINIYLSVPPQHHMRCMRVPLQSSLPTDHPPDPPDHPPSSSRTAAAMMTLLLTTSWAATNGMKTVWLLPRICSSPRTNGPPSSI